MRIKPFLLTGVAVVIFGMSALGVKAAAQDFPADFDWMRVWYLQNNSIDICDPNVYPGFEADWGITKPSDCLDGTAQKLTRSDVQGIQLYTWVNGYREPRQIDLQAYLAPVVNTQPQETQPVEIKQEKVELTEVEKKALEAQKESQPQELSEAEKKTLEALQEANKN